MDPDSTSLDYTWTITWLPTGEKYGKGKLAGIDPGPWYRGNFLLIPGETILPGDNEFKLTVCDDRDACTTESEIINIPLYGHYDITHVNIKDDPDCENFEPITFTCTLDTDLIGYGLEPTYEWTFPFEIDPMEGKKVVYIPGTIGEYNVKLRVYIFEDGIHTEDSDEITCFGNCKELSITGVGNDEDVMLANVEFADINLAGTHAKLRISPPWDTGTPKADILLGVGGYICYDNDVTEETYKLTVLTVFPGATPASSVVEVEGCYLMGVDYEDCE